MPERKQILVVGIGQTLRSDDGIGIKAVKVWRENYAAYLQQHPVEVWLLPEFSMGDLQNAAEYPIVLIVDAMASGAEPGTIKVFSPEALARDSVTGQSAHGWSLAENLELAKVLNISIPEQIILIGIEAKTFDMGENLSPELETTLPEIVNILQSKIETL